MNQSTSLARTIVRQIIEAGITDVVISPGSRNAPLSLAFYHASNEGQITVHVRIDERGAAFFALGLAKATERPVVLVCTSGTAVANYHPAVLEAHHSNTPLLVLTADRPAKLRKTGANQTTNQVHIFGRAVRYFADISGAAYPMEIPLHALLQGPVHLNVQFEEPLLPDDESPWLASVKKTAITPYRKAQPGHFSTTTQRGVVVIGHDRGGLDLESVRRFVGELGWPVIAEDPLSFSEATAHASIFLTSAKIRQELMPHTVVVIGRTTLSRSISALISSAAREVVIDPRMEYVDTDRRADERFFNLPTLSTQPADPVYAQKWQSFSERTAQAINLDWSEALVASEISMHIPDRASFFISSSRPIRDVEGFAKPRHGITTYANRGLAGIDGNLSTILGVSAGAQKTVALIGDLAFLHDVNALIHTEGANVTIFVINNDGGGIFSTLPQRGAPGFETVFGTPHGYSISELALAFKVHALKVENVHDLREQLRQPINGVRVIEVVVPHREKNADYLKEIYRKIESL